MIKDNELGTQDTQSKFSKLKNRVTHPGEGKPEDVSSI